MAIYSKFGSRDTGHYPYTFSVMPEYNGNGPLTKDNIAYIYPVSTNKTDCDNFQFSSTSHYSPTAHDGNAAYVDLDHVYPSNASWYTHLFGSSSSGYTGVGNPLNHPGSPPTTAGSDTGLSAVKGNTQMYSKRRGTSLWMSFSVGTAPHPGTTTAMTYMSILVNSPGAHQGGAFYNANSGGSIPTSPRTLFNNSDKILVSGQSYGNINYREELGWQNKFIFGLHQRKDNHIFSPIPLEAYDEIEDDDTAFLLLGGGENYQKQAKDLGLKNFKHLPPVGKLEPIHKFLNTLDVYAHGRSDGEQCSCAIIEAMSHGLPVISHTAPSMGQLEQIGDAGMVTKDYIEYSEVMVDMIDDKNYYSKCAQNSKKRYNEIYKLESIIKRYADIYRGVVN